MFFFSKTRVKMSCIRMIEMISVPILIFKRSQKHIIFHINKEIPCITFCANVVQP